MENENNNEKEIIVNKNKKNKLKIILVCIVIIIFGLHSYISYKAGYLEIMEKGEEYLDVFYQNRNYLEKILIINFLIVFLSIFITNIIIKKGLKKFFDEEKKEMPKFANKSIAFIIAIIVSIITSKWLLKTTMTALNATQFGILDPIFYYDISFYIFKKPFIEMILLYYIVLIIGLTVYTGIYHIVVFNMFFESIDGSMLRKSIFIKQLLINAMLATIGIAFLVVVKSQGIVLNNFLTLQNDGETILKGAGLTEKIITVWGYRIFAIVVVIAIYTAIRSLIKK